MKKRIVSIFLMGTMILSLAGCMEQKPSLEEVEKAISNGEVTVEDALDKGWITQDWAEAFLDANSHEAADKTVSFAIGEFETTTVYGEKYHNKNIADTTFWAFLDLATEESAEWIETLKNSYQELQEKNAEILVCIKNHTEDLSFENIPFPIIIYNESLKNALDHMNMSEMVEELPNCGNWFANDYFASSWNSMITKEQLLKEADIFTNLNTKEVPAATDNETESASVIG